MKNISNCKKEEEKLDRLKKDSMVKDCVEGW